MNLNILKLIGTFLTFGMTLGFGLIPIFSNHFKSNNRLISMSNSFSGGLFLAIGLLHLLPEANEEINEYFHDEYGIHHPFPWGFFSAIVSFILVLIVDKIIFTKEENHDDEKKISIKKSSILSNYNENEDNLKMKLSNKYKIGLRLSNLSKKENRVDEENLVNHDHGHHHHHHPTINKQTSNFLALVLFFAMGFHSIFEGLALGVVDDQRRFLSTLGAILIHKWAESLTIGISLLIAEVSRKKGFYLILLYAFLSPFGVLVGALIQENTNKLVQNLVLAASAGTFIYISTIEVITEEFSSPKDKWIKLLFFILGFGLNIVVVIFDSHDHGGHGHDH